MSAAPLALLHGFLGASAMWHETLAELAPAGPVLRPELPGHGPAPWFATPPDFDGAVDALAKGLDPAAPAWVVGYSMGARLALGLLARHPARVHGLVLIGVDPGLRSDEARAARIAWDDAQAARVRRDGLAGFVDAWEALPLFASQRRLAAEVRAARRTARLAHTVDGVAWALGALGLGRMPEHWSTLASTRRPLVVLTGALDEKFTALGRAIAAAASGARHVVVPDAGHDLALEAPSAVARAIRAAIDDAEAGR